MNKGVYITGVLVWLQMVFCCMVFSLSAGTLPTTIIVAEFCQVQGRDIVLKDIAQISNAQPYVKEILEGISLGRSPKPGKIKVLRKNKILSYLRTLQTLPGDVRIEAPDKIYVKQAYQTLAETDIRNRVEGFLSDYFGDREYKVNTLQIQKSELYPKGFLEMAASSPLHVDKNGNLSLSLDILVDGQKEDTLRVRGEVAAYDTIACASRPLEKGRLIIKNDIIFMKKNIFDFRGQVVSDMRSLEGQVLKTHVPKNTAIRAAWLAPRPMFKKGDVVALVASTNRLRIETSGIAKEDGFKDKVVRVENIGSGKVVRGLVKKESTVEVIY
jgi:flagella basal body P-ring formation protein FlgA